MVLITSEMRKLPHDESPGMPFPHRRLVSGLIVMTRGKRRFLELARRGMNPLASCPINAIGEVADAPTDREFP